MEPIDKGLPGRQTTRQWYLTYSLITPYLLTILEFSL